MGRRARQDSQWRDLQSEVNYLPVPRDISSAVQVTENASSATTKGAELEAQVRPIKPLTLGVAVGYLDAKFGSFPNATLPRSVANSTVSQRCPHKSMGRMFLSPFIQNSFRRGMGTQNRSDRIAVAVFVS